MKKAPGGPLVLIVESEEGLRTVMEDALEEFGFKVEVLSSSGEAVTLLDVCDGFAAVVTDVDNLRRREISGWEVARNARERNPDISVVYTSGAAGADWAVEGGPKSTFLQKPFAHAQLITALSSI